MANKTGLGIHLDSGVLLPFLCGVDYFTTFVVDTNPLDTGLSSNHRNNLVYILFSIEEHTVVRGLLDDIAHPVGTCDHLPCHLVGGMPDGEIGICAEQDKDQGYRTPQYSDTQPV